MLICKKVLLLHIQRNNTKYNNEKEINICIAQDSES